MATIWRLSDPAAFARLRSTRRRARAGALWLAWVDPVSPSAPPRLAFAIGRKVGGAVVRNQLRRRLRAALAARALPPGDYLVGATPAAGALSWTELNSLVDELVTAVGGQVSVSAAASARPPA